MTSKPTSWCSAALICRCFSLGFHPVCSAFVYTTPCIKTTVCRLQLFVLDADQAGRCRRRGDLQKSPCRVVSLTGFRELKIRRIQGGQWPEAGHGEHQTVAL